MKKLLLATAVIFLLFNSLSLTFASDPKIQYVASLHSNRYHLPWCKVAKRIKPEYLIVFTSIEEAMDNNYIPCKVCKP